MTGFAVSYTLRRAVAAWFPGTQITNNVFDSLKAALANLNATDAILDGELVCLDDEGRDRWNLLLRHRAEPAFYAFDLLWLNGKDLRQLPVIERKKCVRHLIGESVCERIIYVHHIEMCGCVLYRAICKKDLEGIICKRKDEMYSVS